MGLFNSFKKNHRRYFSIKIFKESFHAATLVRKLVDEELKEQQKTGLSESVWFSIFFEFLFFYHHLTDRLAFGSIDEKERGELMNGLIELSIHSAVEALCNRWPDDKIEKIKSDCMSNYYTSMEEYSKYKIIAPGKNASPKDTLFWEFGKVIAKLAGQEMDPIYVMATVDILKTSLKEIDIQTFINKVKKN